MKSTNQLFQQYYFCKRSRTVGYYSCCPLYTTCRLGTTVHQLDMKCLKFRTKLRSLYREIKLLFDINYLLNIVFLQCLYIYFLNLKVKLKRKNFWRYMTTHNVNFENEREQRTFIMVNKCKLLHCNYLRNTVQYNCIKFVTKSRLLHCR